MPLNSGPEQPGSRVGSYNLRKRSAVTYYNTKLKDKIRKKKDNRVYPLANKNICENKQVKQKNVPRDSELINEKICTICYQTVSYTDCLFLINCGHIFCIACTLKCAINEITMTAFDKWSCAICRTSNLFFGFFYEDRLYVNRISMRRDLFILLNKMTYEDKYNSFESLINSKNMKRVVLPDFNESKYEDKEYIHYFKTLNATVMKNIK